MLINIHKKYKEKNIIEFFIESGISFNMIESTGMDENLNIRLQDVSIPKKNDAISACFFSDIPKYEYILK
ncbi:hypothetical protein RC97_08235 [Pectobacterium brasiliense]|nr:hypothetical protein RC97_08235 [Pectobacterium brasiliense]